MADRPAPPIRAVCALGQLWPSGAPVCYAPAPDAIHNARCPEARRLARRRAREAHVWTALVLANWLIWSIVALVVVGRG